MATYCLTVARLQVRDEIVKFYRICNPVKDVTCYLRNINVMLCDSDLTGGLRVVTADKKAVEESPAAWPGHRVPACTERIQW